MEGADVSRDCARMYGTFDMWKASDVFVACGVRDPVLGPPVMEKLAYLWKNGCYYTEIEEAGHFTQEWGAQVAQLATDVFERGGAVEKVREVRPGEAHL